MQAMIYARILAGKLFETWKVLNKGFFVERLWCRAKYERVYLKAYYSVNAARGNIADFSSVYPFLINARRRLPVDLVLPGESSQSMTAFAAPLARFLPEGDALHEGVGNRGSRAHAGTRRAGVS